MKEVKNFYGKDRLNKGYSNNENDHGENINELQKKYEYLLPPVSVISSYEDIAPGTLQKIVAIAEKEQEHKHAIEKMSMIAYEKARRLGALFGLTIALSISYVTFEMSKFSVNKSLVFAAIGFGAMVAMTLLTPAKRNNYEGNKDRKNFHYRKRS